MAAISRRVQRAAAIAAIFIGLAAAAGADQLYLGGPQGVVLRGDPRSGNFQFLGVCGGSIHSLALDGADLFIGDPNGNIYHYSASAGFVNYSFTVPNDARALLMHNGNLLVGGGDGNVLRVDKVNGSVLATLPVGITVDALLLLGSDLYVGSTQGAVFRGDVNSGGFGFFGVCSGPINSLAADATHLFLGTTTGFVYRLDVATQSVDGAFAIANDATAMVKHEGDLLIAGTNASVDRRQRVSGALRSSMNGSFDVQAMVLAESSEPGLPYCYGIGCPCGNDDAEGGCANSSQVGTLLGGSGSASVSTDDLVLKVTQMPENKAGRFYMGLASVQNPFGDGLLCAGSGGYGIQRFPVMNGGIEGSHQLGPGIVAFSHQVFAPQAHIQSGWTWRFQVWHRDPQGPCGGTINTSNAYVVTFLP